MPNNLKNTEATQFKSGSNAVENGRKGGIASGEAKRKKALLRKIAEEVLSGTYTDKKNNEVSGEELITAGFVSNLADSKGRNWGKAIELLMRLTDAEQPQEVNITVDNSLIEALNGTAKEVWEDEQAE